MNIVTAASSKHGKDAFTAFNLRACFRTPSLISFAPTESQVQPSSSALERIKLSMS